MSDSTIDDALKLLEIGKGNPDRLKQIIESFQKRSMISMHDRKYVEALVEQYLTPRHRQMINKNKTIKKQQTNFPRIRKGTDTVFKITEIKTTSGNPYIKPNKEISQPKTSREVSQPRKEKLTPKVTTIEEKFIEHIETDRSSTKKSGKGKAVGIIIGIIAVIIIVGGATYVGSNSELFSTNTEIEERITCENNIQLVSSTRVPGFPGPGKDLEYYQDRYENEPKYKEWFDKNFPGQTIEQVLVPQIGDNETKMPDFPDPEKDLQHYLDRYENEPKYKEWFDKNFPGQTVREVVC